MQIQNFVRRITGITRLAEHVFRVKTFSICTKPLIQILLSCILFPGYLYCSLNHAIFYQFMLKYLALQSKDWRSALSLNDAKTFGLNDVKICYKNMLKLISTVSDDSRFPQDIILSLRCISQVNTHNRFHVNLLLQ